MFLAAGLGGCGFVVGCGCGGVGWGWYCGWAQGGVGCGWVGLKGGLCVGAGLVCGRMWCELVGWLVASGWCVCVYVRHWL